MLADDEGVNMEGAVLIAFVQFVGAVASGYLFRSLGLYKSLFQVPDAPFEPVGTDSAMKEGDEI